MAKGALSRVADIIKADIDDLLSRMEDPGKLIWQMILEMEEAVEEAVATVGRAIGNEKLLERRLREVQAAEEAWEMKAAQAVEAGEDDLARQALHQKATAMGAAQDLEAALEEARQVTAQLKQQLAQFKSKLDEARARQRTLVARCRVAQGRRGVVRHPVGVRTDVFERFEGFCQEVAGEEAAAEVYEEVAGSNPMLDEAFEKLEQKKRVEKELQALKQKLDRNHG